MKSAPKFIPNFVLQGSRIPMENETIDGIFRLKSHAEFVLAFVLECLDDRVRAFGLP